MGLLCETLAPVEVYYPLVENQTEAFNFEVQPAAAEKTIINNMYTRFWFEFDIESAFGYPFGIGIGCGVTAFDYNDAITLMTKNIFFEINMPKIKRVIEDVDVRNLDQGHVIPNMSSPAGRGIWFPHGYL